MLDRSAKRMITILTTIRLCLSLLGKDKDA